MKANVERRDRRVHSRSRKAFSGCGGVCTYCVCVVYILMYVNTCPSPQASAELDEIDDVNDETFGSGAVGEHLLEFTQRHIKWYIVEPLYSGHPWDRSVPNREMSSFQGSQPYQVSIFSALHHTKCSIFSAIHHTKYLYLVPYIIPSIYI